MRTQQRKRVLTLKSNTPLYNVEFFHIYTDEIISDRHRIGVEYLRSAEQAWNFTHTRIVLIDNYNPVEGRITVDDVLTYLDEQGMPPDYWAYEADMVHNAQELLERLTNNKLRKNYLRYISQHGKYPCSLLTAAWYLTRLGYIEAKGVIHATDKSRPYYPVARLLNLLPSDYKPVEDRAQELIIGSDFAAAAHTIQNLFYTADTGRTVDLF